SLPGPGTLAEPLSLLDALPISNDAVEQRLRIHPCGRIPVRSLPLGTQVCDNGPFARLARSGWGTIGERERELPLAWAPLQPPWEDRKSTRLNSSHVKISYAVFC